MNASLKWAWLGTALAGRIGNAEVDAVISVPPAGVTAATGGTDYYGKLGSIAPSPSAWCRRTR